MSDRERGQSAERIYFYFPKMKTILIYSVLCFIFAIDGRVFQERCPDRHPTNNSSEIPNIFRPWPIVASVPLTTTNSYLFYPHDIEHNCYAVSLARSRILFINTGYPCAESIAEPVDEKAYLYRTRVYTDRLVKIEDRRTFKDCKTKEEVLSIWFFPDVGFLIWTCINDFETNSHDEGLIVAAQMELPKKDLAERIENLKTMTAVYVGEDLYEEIKRWLTSKSDTFCEMGNPWDCEMKGCAFIIPNRNGPQHILKTYLLFGSLLIVVVTIGIGGVLKYYFRKNKTTQE